MICILCLYSRKEKSGTCLTDSAFLIISKVIRQKEYAICDFKPERQGAGKVDFLLHLLKSDGMRILSLLLQPPG